MTPDQSAPPDPSFAEMLEALNEDVTTLHWNWMQFRKLYADSGERIDLLNASAPGFWSLLENVLWDDILLRIRRLTEPHGKYQSQARDRRVVSLERLKAACPQHERQPELELLIKSAEEASHIARRYVDKRVAHSDVATHPAFAGSGGGEGAVQLTALSRADVEEMLERIRAAMDVASFIHCGAGRSYIVGPLEDADDLMQCLKRGVDSAERKRRLLESGEATYEDCLPERRV